MAVPLMQKKSFIRSGEGSVASYNWTDVADGTGMIEFLGTEIATSTATSYYLSTLSISGSGFKSVVGTSTSGDTTVADLDFDVSPFNTPRILGGKMIAIATIVLTDGGSCYVVFKVRKVSGGVESEIVSATSPSATGGVTVFKDLAVPITIPQTSFKIGDILRITVELHVVKGALNSYGGLAFDSEDKEVITAPYFSTATWTFPAGRSQLKFLTPFKIDL